MAENKIILTIQIMQKQSVEKTHNTYEMIIYIAVHFRLLESFQFNQDKRQRN